MSDPLQSSLLRSLTLTAVILAVSACTAAARKGKKDASDGTDGADGADGTGDVCANGAKDDEETDVDCGGSCGPCADGKSCVTSADCSSGECGVTYTCVTAACSNGEQDVTETGLDCGGDCLLCPGDKCSADDQCTTGFCKTGLCDTPSCTDGLKNGAETGADCGGECPLCADGQGCLTDANCTSGFCNQAGKCASVSCDDGEKNGDETDVDCGGACEACADGKGCAEKSDCTSGKCVEGSCQALAGTCNSGTKDGDETDIDCGGSCNGCGSGGACSDGEDCASGTCQAGKCTLPASCQDAQLSPGETDVDCGGATCDACGLGKTCKAHDDCLSIACILGQCKEPACDDGVMNGDETDTDCGTTCPACGDGKMCKDGVDCEGGNCTGGFCGSCTDGKKNGAETDEDCGGPCEPCALGKTCQQDADCSSDDCSGGTCVSCDDKVKNGLESDVDCGGGCDLCPVGKACTQSSDCAGDACGDDKKCCAPNACGECGATPVETCNGVDDDCDEETDEDLAAEKCSNQKGVCAGSLATCEGTKGWVCTDDTYDEWATSWVKTESVCDKLDNDCDGQTDEGACTACNAAVTVNEDLMGGSYKDFEVGYEWFAMNGTEPTAALSAYQTDFGFSRSAYLVTPTGFDAVEAGVLNGPGLAEAAGKLYMALRQDLGGFAHYVHAGVIDVGFNDIFTTETDVPGGAHATPIAVGGGRMAFSFVKAPVGKYQLLAGTSDSLDISAGFDTFLLSGADFDSAVAVDVDASGQGHWVFRRNFGDGELVYMAGPAEQESIADEAGPPDMAVAKDGRIFVAFKSSPTGTNVLLAPREVDGSWTESVTVASGVTNQNVAVAVDEQDRPVVAWVAAAAKVHVARVEGEKITPLVQKTLDPAKVDSINRLELVAGENGVLHLAAWLDYLETTAFSFTSTCEGYGDGAACTPSCGTKVCGTDGCGGSCGSCAAGKSCNTAGQCVAGCTPNCVGKECGSNGCGGSCGSCNGGDTCTDSGVCEPAGDMCGADPANSCEGTCNGQGSGGCFCDPDCVGNQDCCPDYQACCVTTCTPSCTGKVCGSDGCGGSCGTCSAGKTCNASGQCATTPALPHGIPAGCLLPTLTLDCNPLTNAGCTAAGSACDLGNSGTECFPEPNTVPANGGCPSTAGAYCVPKYHCTSQSGGTCKKFCCSSTDCGGQACTPLALESYGTLGLCP